MEELQTTPQAAQPEVLFYVQGPVRKDIFLRYNQFHLLGKGDRTKKGLLIFMYVFVWVCSLGLFLPFFGLRTDFVGNLVMFAGCCLFFAALLSVLFFLSPRQAYKRDAARLSVPRGYWFTEREMTTAMLYEGGAQQDISMRGYEALCAVYEAEDAFYVYESPRAAYLITKTGFAKGSPVEFRGFLQAKLGERFHLCR